MTKNDLLLSCAGLLPRLLSALGLHYYRCDDVEFNTQPCVEGTGTALRHAHNDAEYSEWKPSEEYDTDDQMAFVIVPRFPNFKVSQR